MKFWQGSDLNWMTVSKQNTHELGKSGRALGLFSFIATRLSRHLHKHPSVLRFKQEILFFNKKTKILNDYHPIS